jgi:hypothetical protein
MHKKLDPIEKKISGIKEELRRIGEMRPGSLTYQYQRPKDKKGGFYQISYTYRMKSKTEYVKAEFVQVLATIEKVPNIAVVVPCQFLLRFTSLIHF